MRIQFPEGVNTYIDGQGHKWTADADGGVDIDQEMVHDFGVGFVVQARAVHESLESPKPKVVKDEALATHAVKPTVGLRMDPAAKPSDQLAAHPVVQPAKPMEGGQMPQPKSVEEHIVK